MIFTVYHKVLDGQEVWGPFEAGEVARFFTPYAVSKHPKTLLNAPPPVVEAELPWHNPLLQQRGFLETSCYVHILRNNLHLPHELVGVTQYDMRWTPEAAAILRSAGPSDTLGVFCGVLAENGVFHKLAFPAACDWGFMLRSYNARFGASYALNDLDGLPLTLLQTYVLPRALFAELAGWLEVLCEELYPWANQPPYPAHWGALSGWTERAEALFVAIRFRERRIRLNHLPLINDAEVARRLGVAREHYGTRAAAPAWAG